MIILLDTTVLVNLLRRRGGATAQIEDLVENGHTLATSVISLAEIYAGLRTEEEARAETLLNSLALYSITANTGAIAGRLKRGKRLQGRTVSLLDMLIAATALEHGLTLMTGNVKDFELPELKLYAVP